MLSKLLLVAPLAAEAMTVQTAKPNPIRRVLNLLEEMATEIEAEVAKEEKQLEKFKCYCKKNDGELGKKAAEAAALIKKTTAEVEANTALKKQLTEEIAKHKKDRKQAEKDLDSATKKRAEEKAKYEEDTKSQRKTIADIDAAIGALQKGLGKSFLQTNTAAQLKSVFTSSTGLMNMVSDLDMAQQQTVVSFLESSEGTGNSSEIVGILKVMKDNIDEALGGVIGDEEKAVESFKTLKATLEDLIKVSGRSIEKKGEEKGNVAVKVVEGKSLITITTKEMGDSQATLMELKKTCKDAAGEFDIRKADALAEVEAIGQAVEVLGNDDALQLFNKTDTKDLMQVSKSAFIQMSAKLNEPKAIALHELSQLQNFSKNKAVAMLAYSASQQLRAGKVDFSKILKMIEDMVAVLKQEAADDLKSRDDCTENLNSSTADKKDAEQAISTLTAEIEEHGENISLQEGIIKKAAEDIAAAKTSMAESTETRKAQNAAFVEAVSLNSQAVELLQKAKDKLNAYYNPDLVSEAGKEAAAAEAAGEGETALVQALPEGAPEMTRGERKNKSQKGGSVIAILDQMVKDVENDSHALEHEETVAQKDYEELSADLAKSVADSEKQSADAAKTKTDAQDKKLTAESTLSMKTEELNDVTQTIADLHAQCDFILKAFEERKAARETEIAGLGKAGMVLRGAKLD